MGEHKQISEAVERALEEAVEAVFEREPRMDLPPYEAFKLKEDVTAPAIIFKSGAEGPQTLPRGIYWQNDRKDVFTLILNIRGEQIPVVPSGDEFPESIEIEATPRPVGTYVNGDGEVVGAFGIKTGELIVWKAMERAEAAGDPDLAEEIFFSCYSPVEPSENDLPRAPAISYEGASAYDPTGTKFAQFMVGSNQAHLYEPGGVHLKMGNQRMDVILERLEDAGGSFTITRELTQHENDVMAGVCNAIINGYPMDEAGEYGVSEGPYRISPAKIYEGMGLDTRDPAAFAELEDTISYLSTIQATAIVPLRGGKTKREAGQLIEYSRTSVILPDGRISEDYYTFGQLPLIYRVAKDLNQVKTYPIAALKSSSRGSEQTLRRMVAQRVASVCNGSAHAADNVIRIVREPRNPGRAIELEQTGYDLTSAKVRARVRRIIDDELSTFETGEEPKLERHEWGKDKGYRTIAYVAIFPAKKGIKKGRELS